MAHETHPPELVRGLLIRFPETGWARRAHDSLLPGAHAAVFGGFSVPLEAEDAQLVVRDCLSVVGPVRHQVWLIRRPLSEPTVAAQVLRTASRPTNEQHDDRELVETEAEIAKGDTGGQYEPDITDARVDRIAQRRVEPGMGEEASVEPALQRMHRRPDEAKNGDGDDDGGG